MTDNGQNKNCKGEARRVFARRLKEIRIQKGFSTARSLANTLGIDENRYTRYERAEVEPDLHLISRICDVLGVQPNDLLRQGNAATNCSVGVAGQPLEPHGQRLAPVNLPTDGFSAVDAIAWKLGCLVARVSSTGHGTDTGTMDDGANLTFLRLATMRYRELCLNPFSAIGQIVQDPDVLRASGEVQQQISALCMELVEARSSN